MPSFTSINSASQSTFSPSVGRPQPRLWPAAIAAALSATALLWDARPGINWLLMVLIGATLLSVVERPGRRALLAPRYWLLAAGGVLAASASVTASARALLLAFATFGWLLAIVMLLAAGLVPAQFGPTRLLAAPLRALAPLLNAARQALRDGARVLGDTESQAVVRGSVLSIVLVAVCFALLAEAEPVLADWRHTLRTVIETGGLLGHTLCFAACLPAALGFYHLNAAKRGPRATEVPDSRAAMFSTGPERLIVLGGLAALLATFLALRLQAALAAPARQLGGGVTYAAAVHQGFAEITIVAVLCATTLVLLDRHARRGAQEHRVQLLGRVLVGECLLLLVVAERHLWAYELAYGYTLARVYLQAYIAVLAVWLALLATELGAAIDVDRLCRRAAAATVLAVAVLSYWNAPAWIVRHNLERYQQLGRVDLDYLAALGPDAVPELVGALPSLPPAERRQLVAELRRRAGGASGAAPPRWFEWNFRRAAADRALAGIGDAP